MFMNQLGTNSTQLTLCSSKQLHRHTFKEVTTQTLKTETV